MILLKHLTIQDIEELLEELEREEDERVNKLEEEKANKSDESELDEDEARILAAIRKKKIILQKEHTLGKNRGRISTFETKNRDVRHPTPFSLLPFSFIPFLLLLLFTPSLSFALFFCYFSYTPSYPPFHYSKPTTTLRSTSEAVVSTKSKPKEPSTESESPGHNPALVARENVRLLAAGVLERRKE